MPDSTLVQSAVVALILIVIGVTVLWLAQRRRHRPEPEPDPIPESLAPVLNDTVVTYYKELTDGHVWSWKIYYATESQAREGIAQHLNSTA